MKTIVVVAIGFCIGFALGASGMLVWLAKFGRSHADIETLLQ
jgi:hypothetical protein